MFITNIIEPFRSVVGNIFRRINGTIVGKPTNFSWLISGKVAASGLPMTSKEFNWIKSQGIKTILTLTESNLQQKPLSDNSLTNNHLPIINHFSPSIVQLSNSVDFIHENVINNILNIREDASKEEFIANVFKLTKTKHIIKARKYVIENEQSFNNDYPFLLKELFNHIEGSKIEFNKKRLYLLTVSEYLYRTSHVLDQEINFFSCLLALSQH